MHRAVAGGAEGGKASGVSGATTERGGEQGHGPAYAARRIRQGGGRGPATYAARCVRFVKVEVVVKGEEGSDSRPKRQRAK